ncbi:MAG: FecR family protein [Thermodesulfovibrionales bacterium]
MKILKTAMIATVLLLVPAYAFCANLGWMRVSLIEGDVQIKTPEAGDWGLTSINTPLSEGDQVWVPQGGRAELQLNSGTYIRLDQNSALQILSMDKDSSQVYLSQGSTYIFSEAPRGSVMQVDTPDASTRSFDRVIFRIDVSDQYTDVAIYKGYVETENQVGKTGIRAGQTLSLGQNTNGEVAPMGPPDEWEKWNRMRNEEIFAKRDISSRYLPAELREYSYDFDNSGRWVQVPGYGFCWTPTAVGPSWAPYREGNWIWRRGDYVWVDYEPWGWAPYHYGRWAFVAGIGWCWVPPVAGEVYWGPGFVGWVKTVDYVAWVPLAPGEIYYGRGYYGQNSVNIVNTNINQVNITNVYKNVYVNNGVTVVNRNTFATASPRIVNVNQNIIQREIFTRNNISLGTPAIRPSKESFFAVARPIPPAKLPPKPIRNLQISQLKQSRPLIKEPNKSVLNPGARINPLPLNTVSTPRTVGKGTPMLQPIQPAAQGKPGSLGGPAPGGPQPKQVEKKPLPHESAPAPHGGPQPKQVEKKPLPHESAPAPKKPEEPTQR